MTRIVRVAEERLQTEEEWLGWPLDAVALEVLPGAGCSGECAGRLKAGCGTFYEPCSSMECCSGRVFSAAAP